MELPLTLTRPMAKLRVVAKDYCEISNYSTPTQMSVTFDTDTNPIYKSFDAVDNKILDNCAAHTYNYSVSPAPYKEYVGKTVRVLVDGESGDARWPLSSRTHGGRLVHLAGDTSLIGQYIDVTVTDSNTWALFGELEE